MTNKFAASIKHFLAHEDTKKVTGEAKEVAKKLSKLAVVRYVIVTSLICAVIAIPIPFIGQRGGAIVGAFLGVYIFGKSR